MSTATVTVNVGTDVSSVSRRAIVWRIRLSVSPVPVMAAAGGAGGSRLLGPWAARMGSTAPPTLRSLQWLR